MSIIMITASAAPPPPPARPLDPYSAGMWACGGIKQLLSSYVGPLLKVRRSTDSTQQDINYLSDGTLDTTSLLAFVGGGDGWVTIAYDQSNNGNHFEASTSGTEPRIVLGGVYDGALIMNATPTMTLFGSVTTFPSGSTGGGFYASVNIRTFVGDDPIFTSHPIASTGNNGIAFQNSTSDNLLSAFYFNGAPSGSNYWHKRYPLPSTGVNYQYGYTIDNVAATGSVYKDGAGLAAVDAPTATITTDFTATTIYLGNSTDSLNQSKFNSKNFAVYHIAPGTSESDAITTLLG